MSTGARVILLANDAPGLEVARYLRARGDQIVRLYLHDPERRRLGEEIAAAANASTEWFAAAALRDREHVSALPELGPDYIVTVFWAHLLSDEVLSSARRGTVNFHPALLPHNRGWFPHVHSIVDGSPAGVTLHAMDAGADTGPIWAQRSLAVEPWDTAFTLQKRLQAAIVELFRETWPRIVDGTLQPTPQSEAGASFHGRADVDALDHLDLGAPTTGRRFLDVLRARSYGDRAFAFFEEEGRRVYVNVRLGLDPEF
jgi:methionyl-tRNA formyltransferase